MCMLIRESHSGHIGFSVEAAQAEPRTVLYECVIRLIAFAQSSRIKSIDQFRPNALCRVLGFLDFVLGLLVHCAA